MGSFDHWSAKDKLIVKTSLDKIEHITAIASTANYAETIANGMRLFERMSVENNKLITLLNEVVSLCDKEYEKHAKWLHIKTRAETLLAEIKQKDESND